MLLSGAHTMALVRVLLAALAALAASMLPDSPPPTQGPLGSLVEHDGVRPAGEGEVVG